MGYHLHIKVVFMETQSSILIFIYLPHSQQCIDHCWLTGKQETPPCKITENTVYFVSKNSTHISQNTVFPNIFQINQHLTLLIRKQMAQ